MTTTIYFETILPGGRALRARKLDTAQYLDAREEGMVKVADVKDPVMRDARLRAVLEREMASRAIVAVTEPRDWSEELKRQEQAHATKCDEIAARLRAEGKEVTPDALPPFTPDLDAALASIPDEAWRSLTPLDLLVGERALLKLFSEVEDYQSVIAFVEKIMAPKSSWAALVGKARQTARS